MSIELEHISVILPRVIKRIEGQKMDKSVEDGLWINVEDELPNNGQKIRVYGVPSGGDDIVTAEFVYFDEVKLLSNITHWMPA